MNPWSYLSSLILDFTQCRRIYDKGLENLGDGLKKLTSLSVLFLTCILSNLTEKSILGLSSGLSELRTLSHLKINFQLDAQPTDKHNIESLGSSLKHLDQLETPNSRRSIWR